MTALTVKIETNGPARFREFDEAEPAIDIELEAFVTGETKITGFDCERFATQEEAAEAVKADAHRILWDCLKTWPVGKSVMKSDKNALIAGFFDGKLADRGIFSKTVVTDFRLNSDSEKIYTATVRMAAMLAKQAAENAKGEYPYSDEVPELDEVPEDTSEAQALYEEPEQNNTPVIDEPREEAAENQPEDRFCRRCGAKRPANARFCPECGTKFG
ncbi:MAG: zinc-ribbon domain-containing protein [Clostridia bacterium]|nr:zinc-ribbon domain-containing protein [Clostridia bacterium]